MTTLTLCIALLIFALTFWLGCYLNCREPGNPTLHIAGSALLAFALATACIVLNIQSLPVLELLYKGFLLISALLTITGTISLIRKYRSLSSRLAGLASSLPILLLATIGLFILTIGILLVAPLNGSLHIWLQLLAGIAGLLAGLVVAFLHTSTREEALLPDLFRSFDFSIATALFFGAQVALVIILATGSTIPMLLLLLAVIASSIILQTFSDQVMTLLDKLAFANFPHLQKTRAELRTAATAIPRTDPYGNLDEVDDTEFARLTRRALSSYGDLSRLAASPLTHLPAIDARLSQNGHTNDPLERAIILKTLLTESICRLKPQHKGEFGSSNEWRHYNALYFPYIIGLKPYSLRNNYPPDDPTAREALTWFQSQVPERTLHNWQNAATKIIAQDLRRKTC